MQSVKENLLAAFRYLLKPLVRLAMRNGVSFSEFSESLKAAYVDVAAVKVRVSSGEPTEDRIALMTTVPKMEVQRILRTSGAAEFASAAQREQPLPNLLTAWYTNPIYAGPYGVCRDLKFLPDEPPGDSDDEFASLASTACPGVAPAVVLDELLRTGCVVSVGNGYYRAVKRSYVPDPLSAASVLLFAQVVHNFCETAELNLRTRESKNGPVMQRIIFTRFGITKSDLADFDKFLRIRGQAFADDVDNWLSDRDRQGNEQRINTGVGFYHYIVNEDDELALSKKLPN